MPSMGPHFLNSVFAARSVALFGPSEDRQSVGGVALHNLLNDGFRGAIYPIAARHRRIQGQRAFRDLAAIGRPVDMAVIATPAERIADAIAQCGANGVGSAIVLSRDGAGIDNEAAPDRAELLTVARDNGVRILGPDCLGVMRPAIGLNATFSRNRALPGDLALVSQSGALCTAVLDWAETQPIGFSAVASLGSATDIDVGDVLDFLALDYRTRSILLYLEGVGNARGFMSGLRAAARMKPVIVIKSGRHEASVAPSLSHTGALVGADDVFDAALERAGAVRVNTVEQLFSAARILSGGYRVRGERLAVVTNAAGPAVMAADRAMDLEIPLSGSDHDSGDAAQTERVRNGPCTNPLDLGADADATCYRSALQGLASDRQVDGILAMLTPQALTDPLAVARAVTALPRNQQQPVIACWMGGRAVRAAREHLTEHRVPHFSTPEASVEAFGHLAAFRRSQELLLQVPTPLSDQASTDVTGARRIIEAALAQGREMLRTSEAKEVLRAFRIPVTEARCAASADEAVAAATALGYPVAIKVDSPDITHKSAVDGIRLNVVDAEAVRAAFAGIMESAAEHRPAAWIDGVTVECMHRSVYGREVMIGALRDSVFGPVVVFGSGGTSVEVIRDRAIALPPLDETIIRGMVGRTRVARLLERFGSIPAVDIERLEQVLIRLSELVCELPEVRELDINPLVADERGLVAVDARIGVDRSPSATQRYAHMAIHPYPAHLATQWHLDDGTVLCVRPIRPEDAASTQAFVRGLSDQSRYFRFMHALHELSTELLVRYTQIDYDREMALIAIRETQEGPGGQVGVARYTANPDRLSCEFALAVADAWQGRGIGSYLMRRLMAVAAERGLAVIEGEVLAENTAMLALMRRLGFTLHSNPENPGVREVSRRLDDLP